jgi:hypothetical protein
MTMTTQQQGDIRATEVEVPARVSIFVVDGEVREMQVQLLGGSPLMQKALVEPEVVEPSGSVAHDAVALEAADGLWPLNWQDLPSWLRIES